MNCQKEMADNTLFCGVCGYKVEKQVKYCKVNNIFAWILAFYPIYIIITESMIIYITRPLHFLFFSDFIPSLYHTIRLFSFAHGWFFEHNRLIIILPSLILLLLLPTFIFLDIKALKKSGYRAGFIYWAIGLISAPAYLLFRSKETNSKFTCAIVSIVLLLIYVLILIIQSIVGFRMFN